MYQFSGNLPADNFAIFSSTCSAIWLKSDANSPISSFPFV